MSARDRIHAMFNLDEAAETELNARLDAYRVEVLNEAADFVGNDDECDCGGCDTCVPRKLADGLRRLAGESNRGADADFFEPGHTYLRFVGDRELYFRVTSVSSDNPNAPGGLSGAGPVAFGWTRTERSTTVWGPSGQTSFAGWHDATEGGAS